eukprot:6474743-Amphidinium_carterae.1
MRRVLGCLDGLLTFVRVCGRQGFSQPYVSNLVSLQEVDTLKATEISKHAQQKLKTGMADSAREFQRKFTKPVWQKLT